MVLKIGPLTIGRRETVIVEPEPRPEPEKINFGSEGDSFADYAEVAKQIGFSNGAMVQAQLLHFLQREEIVIYKTDRVNRYMDSLVQRENQLNPKGEPKVWCWKPLRADDVGKLTNHLSDHTNGHISHRQYQNAVPISALKIVAKIAAEFPDAKFYVTDYMSERPDPFLGVTGVGFDFIVVDVWDEPGFRSTK